MEIQNQIYVLIDFNELSAIYLIWCCQVSLISQLEASEKMKTVLKNKNGLEVTLLNISVCD